VVNDGLKQISLNDKLAIREFVKLNLVWHQASHVIYFDNKPMSLASARLKSPDRQLMDIVWIKGWKAFKRHEHLFPHPNFIFNSEIDEEDDDWKSINLFIINKRALAQCFNYHLHIFQEVLGKICSFNWFVRELENKKSVYEIVKNDERLLGILLGYGEESATIFQHHQTFGLSNCSSELDLYRPIDAKVPQGCTLFPVVIMGNPHSTEVQSLMSTYEKELEIFWHDYQKQDPLVLFLKCICEEK